MARRQHSRGTNARSKDSNEMYRLLEKGNVFSVNIRHGAATRHLGAFVG